MNEFEELMDINGDEDYALERSHRPISPREHDSEHFNFGVKSTQWASSDGEMFVPTASTVPILPPGYYEIDTNPNVGLYFSKLSIKLDGILRFPDAS